MHWPRAPALGRPPRSSHTLSVLILPDWQVTSSPDYPQNERPFHYFVPPQRASTEFLKPSPLCQSRLPASSLPKRGPFFQSSPALPHSVSYHLFSFVPLSLKSAPRSRKIHFPQSARAIAIATTDRPTDSIRIWHQNRQPSISVLWDFRENPLRRPPFTGPLLVTQSTSTRTTKPILLFYSQPPNKINQPHPYRHPVAGHDMTFRGRRLGAERPR